MKYTIKRDFPIPGMPLNSVALHTCTSGPWERKENSGAHSRAEPSCFPRSSSCFAISVKLKGPFRVQRDDSAHIRIRRHLPVVGREAPLAGAVGIFNTGVASESYGSVYCYVTAGKLFERSVSGGSHWMACALLLLRSLTLRMLISMCL